jgi:hypothetical protein
MPSQVKRATPAITPTSTSSTIVCVVVTVRAPIESVPAPA